MGHDNIDKLIKNKLEKRVIEPSTNSWNKLDAMLSEDKKKKKFPFYWIAASVILALSTFFIMKDQNFNNSSEINPTNQVVNNNENQTETKQEVIKKEPIDLNKNNIEIVLNKKQKSKVDKKKFDSKPIIKYAQTNKVNKPKKEPNLIEKETVLIATKNTDELKKQAINNEVDALLANALVDLEKENNQSIKNSLQNKQVVYQVDANELLNEVEEELDLSFKEKVFKKIKTGFKKTRTAVVKRND